jgi:hypothetical protein
MNMNVKYLQIYSHACTGGNLTLNSAFYVSQIAMVICITQFAAEIAVVVWRSILFLPPSIIRCTGSILNSLSNFFCTVFMHTSGLYIKFLGAMPLNKERSMRKIIQVVKKIIIN